MLLLVYSSKLLVAADCSFVLVVKPLPHILITNEMDLSALSQDRRSDRRLSFWILFAAAASIVELPAMTKLFRFSVVC